MTTPWLTPKISSPVYGTVHLPGSKSLTARALVLSSLHANKTHPVLLKHALLATDSILLMDGLRQLGADITISQQYEQGNVDILVSQNIFTRKSSTVKTTIDVGIAGTVLRFIPPLACIKGGAYRFISSQTATHRPIEPLLTCLQNADPNLHYHFIDNNAGVPFDLELPITGWRFSPPIPQLFTIDASQSSQFLSALLLASTALKPPSTIAYSTIIPSRPHVDMTLACLSQFGWTYIEKNSAGQSVCQLTKHSQTPNLISIEPDLSNAGPFIAAAAVSGGKVTIPNWPSQTTQVGALWPKLLQQMGCISTYDNTAHTLTLVGPPHGQLHGLTLDLSQAGELVPTISALAVLANSPSRFTGIAHLRGHETDRLTALATEINKLGAKCHILSDGIEIIPPVSKQYLIQNCILHTYNDHRMATFGAIIGLAINNTQLDDVDCTAKTLPNFVELWQNLVQPTPK